MKFLGFWVISVMYGMAVLCSADMRQIMQECMSETQVKETDLKEFMDNGMKSTAKDNLKCYSKCLMEKQGHMKNGQFNAQTIIDTLKNVPQLKEHQDEINNGVQACKDIVGTNECDTAFKIFMCLKEHRAIITH